jgi:hypothetical protein
VAADSETRSRMGPDQPRDRPPPPSFPLLLIGGVTGSCIPVVGVQLELPALIRFLLSPSLVASSPKKSHVQERGLEVVDQSKCNQVLLSEVLN